MFVAFWIPASAGMTQKGVIMRTLYIDTSSNKKAVVGLKIDGVSDMAEQESTVWKSQAVLPLLTSLLKKHTLKLTDIDSIEVVSGPGSFTGLRVGVAIANTLGTWLKVPINGRQIGQIVDPIYQ